MIAMAKNPLSAIRSNPRFQSLLSAHAFPGRHALYIYEIARVLRISEKHVIALIADGSFGAVDVAKLKNESTRRFYRVAVSDYDAFIKRGGKP